MTDLVFVIGAEHAPYLDRALRMLLRRMREAGVRAPADILELAEWAWTVAHGLSSPLPDLLGDDGPVPQLLTLPEVADELGCSLSKVKKLVADGKLRTVDFDGRRRVLRSDFDAFVASLAPRSFRDTVERKGSVAVGRGRSAPAAEASAALASAPPPRGAAS